MTVGEVCTRQVVTVQPDAAVLEIARLMRDKHVGDVIVVSDEKMAKPIGILTDRDIVIGILAKASDKIDTLRVSDVMSPDLVTALETDALETALAAMRASGVRRLPVVDHRGMLRGILTFDDIVELMSEEFRDLARVVSSEQIREREQRM